MKGLVSMTALSRDAAVAGGFIPAAPADLARGQNQDPGVTPAQGRVVFHQERLFRSTGNARPGAYPEYIKACQDEGLPARICEWTREQCRVALHLMEIVCHKHRMDCFRDCRTGWEAL